MNATAPEQRRAQASCDFLVEKPHQVTGSGASNQGKNQLLVAATDRNATGCEAACSTAA
jgi:hypothetical protein